jgi:hypothetical protein
MITPRSPPSFGWFLAMASAARRSILKLPIRLISMVRRKLSRPWAPLRPMTFSAGATPAQLTSPCTAPKACNASSTAARPSASLLMSARRKRARSPSSAAALAPASALMSSSSTLAP